jgi:hypothetical protein
MTDLNTLLNNWYTLHKVQPAPNLKGHDTLHALLGEGIDWESEMRVGVLDYVYHSLLRDEPLNLKGVRTFLGTVVEAMHMYGASNAYDFFTDEELSRRITASVKILRQVGIDNI